MTAAAASDAGRRGEDDRRAHPFTRASRSTREDAVSWSAAATPTSGATVGGEQPARRPGLASSASTRRAERERGDEAGGEARLGGRRAGVVLDARRRLQRAGEVAQQPGEVAAGLALEQDRGDDRVPGRRGARGGAGARGRLRRLAGAERRGGAAQLVAGGAVEPAAASSSAPRTERPAASASASARAAPAAPPREPRE